MVTASQRISSIGEIRAQLASAIKSWNQQTSDLIWPEHDSSLAAMDGHIARLRVINARLAVVESMPPSVQSLLAACFDEDCVQDPGKFASFAAEVERAAA